MVAATSAPRSRAGRESCRGRFSFGGLPGDDVLDRRRQFLFHRVFVGADGRVFAALGFGQDGVAIARI